MKNKKIILFLQGGLGNQLYQLYAAYSFSDRSSFFIEDDYFYQSDFFKRRPSYTKIINKNNIESIKINNFIVFVLKIFIKLAIHKIIKPVYFDHESRDCVLKIFNIYFMIGYFQNSNWNKFTNDKLNQKNINSFLNNFLLNNFRTEKLLEHICIHIRNLQIDYIIDSDYFINKFEKIPMNYKQTCDVVISSEDNNWFSDYENLYNYLILKKYKLLNITDFNVGISTMIFSKVFIGTKSTLSDWIVYIRLFNNFQDAKTYEYE